jgi:Flp pilus assembly protein TadG
MTTRARRRIQDGQSLVEFALIFPLLILLLVGIFDAGRLVFAYNDITNAAREAARVGIVNQNIASIQTEAVSQATTLGLTAATNIDVKFCQPDGTGCTTTPPTNLDSLVQVQVSYDWHAITPVIGSIIGPVTVHAESRMPIERVYP